MPPKNVRVTAEIWGAGPGMGGTSYVEFKLNDEVYDVFAGGTSLDGREKLGEVKLSDGWRGRVCFIVEKSPPYHEEKSPGDIDVRGAKNPEAQLLAAAWSGEGGAQFAGLVLELEDSEIEKLIDKTQGDWDTAIDTVSRARSEVGAVDEEILIEIRNLIQSDDGDWDQLLTTLVAKEAEESSKRVLEALAAKAAREKSLEPFQSQITQAINAWIATEAKDNQPINPNKMSGLREFLENFALSHGHMPSGTVSINYSYRGKYGAKFGGFFEFDLDSLPDA